MAGRGRKKPAATARGLELKSEQRQAVVRPEQSPAGLCEDILLLGQKDCAFYNLADKRKQRTANFLVRAQSPPALRRVKLPREAI